MVKSAAMIGSSLAATSADAARRLQKAIVYLLEEADATPYEYHHVRHSKSNDQLLWLRALLCRRPASPRLPGDILDCITTVIKFDLSHRLMTSLSSILPITSYPRSNHSPLHLRLWRGDITTLSGVTAIVNAANSQLLGCFQPSHRCIDNVIHSAAGPELREECARLVDLQEGRPEPPGTVKVTPGFCLPSPYVLHTVGPQIHSRRSPTTEQAKELASCYTSCLDAAAKLPTGEDGRLSVAFCCISTGLFAFPRKLAAKIAVDTVMGWIAANPITPLTDVVFDVFLEEDEVAYEEALQRVDENMFRPVAAISQQGPPISGQESSRHESVALDIAKRWLADADNLIISAGAGLSAATGLDYTSKKLFRDNFHGFLELGFERLYDVMGFDAWPDEQVKWGYHFTHMALVRSWPKSRQYQTLLSLAEGFQGKYFVRTTNADGLFYANGFPHERISTPQGQYRYLQCLVTCRRDAIFETSEFLDAALPFIDPKTQRLTDAKLVPSCKYCGGKVTLCVRGGAYFNHAPFKAQERAWETYVDNILEDTADKKTVVLELGVGFNTPGVLRYPNERLVNQESERFKLIRVSLGAASHVSWDLQAAGAAVNVDGDINSVLEYLARG